MHRSLRLGVGLVGIAAVAAACSAAGGSQFTTSSTTGKGGNGQGGNAQGGNGQGAGINITSGGGTSNTTTGAMCNSGPDQDMDGDGWTFNEGDCNDCDPNVNPGAIEVVNSDPNAPAADENCDGMVDNIAPPCDSNLALTDTDAKNGARAIDLCTFTVANPGNKNQKTWGVFDAQYTRANGTTFSPGAQVGIQSGWGTTVHVQGGDRLLAISSGHARTPSQSGACGSLTCMSNDLATAPSGFPQDNPNCPPSTDIHDDVALQLKIRTPTNATGYSFDFKFYSFEYPEWVCNDFNDQFIALVLPAPTGSINGNISFDSMHNPVSVNLGFFDVCDPAGKPEYASNCGLFGPANCPSPPNPYCPSGTAELAGTGFDVWDNAGATSWLKSQAPVKGGSDMTIRFMMWDTGDQAYDSTTLIDNFQWIANGGTVTVGTDPIGTPK